MPLENIVDPTFVSFSAPMVTFDRLRDFFEYVSRNAPYDVDLRPKLAVHMGWLRKYSEDPVERKQWFGECEITEVSGVVKSREHSSMIGFRCHPTIVEYEEGDHYDRVYTGIQFLTAPGDDDWEEINPVERQTIDDVRRMADEFFKAKPEQKKP